jgi:hypothetical protein
VNAERVPPEVIDDLEEIFDSEGLLPLYQVSWTTSGFVSRDDDRFDALCREAFETFQNRHPDLQVVWVRWPIDVSQARPVDPATAIDLDLDPDAPTDT